MNLTEKKTPAKELDPADALHLLRLKDVKTRTALSTATIYNKMNAGTFPKPRRLTSACVRWLSTDIDRWIESLPINGDPK